MTEKHLQTKSHLEKARKREVCKELPKPNLRNCFYRCDRGIHKGRYLEDICRLHPDYIDFLLRKHRHTFPDKFVEALKQCDVDPDKYLKNNN